MYEVRPRTSSLPPCPFSGTVRRNNLVPNQPKRVLEEQNYDNDIESDAFDHYEQR